MGKLPSKLVAICICSVVLGLSPSTAPAQADDTARSCTAPLTTPEATIAGCSALIDARAASGRQLAAAYSQRGYARTLKRDLGEAEKDLDEAIRIDPEYAEAYANRANFWTVSKKPERALADAEQAVRLNPELPM